MAATFVIVGASLAGGTAAATLRNNGFDGTIVLVGEEPVAPYERPPLSKQFLRGEVAFETALVRPLTFWTEQGIECRFGIRAVRLDPAARVVELSDGNLLAYDKLLVATGLRNRRLSVPGADLEGVQYLRTVAESEAIAAGAAGAGTAVVVGMGFIGSEVAASLRQRGVPVVAVEPLPTPVYRALGPEVGAMIAANHADHGVELRTGESVAAFEGNGRLERLVTTTGRRIECDLAVVGVGAAPVTDWLEGSGVDLDNGVVVDATCRTNVDAVFAAGDIARHFHPRTGDHIRVEHWENALKQGAAAAGAMLGSTEPYNAVHWFWSDQYDTNIQSAGRVGDWASAVVRGSLSDRSCVAFWLAGDRIEGAVAVNRGRDLRRSLALIASGAQVDPARLADPDVDVRAAAV